MRNVKLTIQYDGTAYAGWQYQKNAKTIQGTMEAALKKILGEKVHLTGAGRTDAGVHAEGQVANFKARSKLAPDSVKKALNSLLPGDIVVTGARQVSLRFHSRFDARSKLYRYTIATGGPVSPFVRHFAGRCPCRLDIKAMKKAAGILVGRHDFRSFQAKAAGGKSSVRAIHYIRLENSENMVYIYINADGFLYNMARNIAGTLIKVGRGRISPGSVRDILSRKDRRSGGPTAPAKGLCLLKVAY